jgi:hypothetical protein
VFEGQEGGKTCLLGAMSAGWWVGLGCVVGERYQTKVRFRLVLL